MYDNKPGSKAVKPSRIRRILVAIVFMLIGAGIGVVVSSSYWSQECQHQYNLGKADGITQGVKQYQAKQDEAMTRVARSEHMLSIREN